MESDSRPIEESRSEAKGVALKFLLAIALGLAFAGFVGATAWSAEEDEAPAGVVQEWPEGHPPGVFKVGADRAPAGSAPYSDPELRSVETPDEAKIRQLRAEEVTQLRIALGRRSPVNRRADLYLRLAEIDLEAYRSEYLLEGRLHSKKLERGESDKFIDHSHSRPYLISGIKACKEILSFGIPYPKLDQVYYFLGYNHGELDDRKESLKYYDYLIRNFPSSQYVGEAYRELGEAAFDSNLFRKAQAYLEQAAQRANGDSLPRIYHRLAWSYYRTKQYERAVDTMKQAIAAAQKSGEKFLSVREEALRDMAIFMTETGRVDEAISYFQGASGDRQFYPHVLERLGKQYERNVEPAKATQVYESLLRTSPDSEAAFRVRVKLVDLDLRRGRYADALKRLGGVTIPKGGEHDTEVAAQNLRAMVRRTATEHHEEFRKKSSRPGLEVAESFYGAYLGFLSQEDPRGETPEIEMYLAEVRRDLGKAKEASELYRKVLDSKDKRYAKEAGALWTASLAEAIRKAAPPKGAAKADEPSALETEFVDAADSLHEALAGTNEGREAALKAAEVLAGYKNTQKQAIKRVRRLVTEEPKSAQALTGARLWIQVLADKLPSGASAAGSDAADDLKDAMKELRANSALMESDGASGGKLKGAMAEQESRIRIGAIAKEEQSSDFASAAKGYESFASDSGSRDLAEKAYGNAVSTYIKAADTESVTRVAGSWLKRYPKSAKAVDSIRAAATHYLVSGRFDAAASLFEQLGREGGDPDSLETAARIREGTGDMLRAQQDWSSYIQDYPSGGRRWPAILELARSYDAGRDDSRATQTYKACLGAPAEVGAECGARLADLYLRNQNTEEARKVYKQVAGMTGGGGRNSPFVGYARFKLADLMEQSAQFDRLELPEANLKKAMSQRLEFLEPLSRAYLSAVEAGGPFAVAALDRLATWAMNFADDVDNIQPPQSAEGDQIQAFHKSLAAVSAPLRKKAIATWKDGYAKALEAESLSPVLPEMLDRMADARVPEPGRAQGYRGRLRLGGIPADGGTEGKSAATERVRAQLLKNPQDSAAWSDYGNLLWGEGKWLLAKIAYERALALNPRNMAALNNRGVIAISGGGQGGGAPGSEEDWMAAVEASQLFGEALKADEFYLPAKMNRASLMNYYRLFAKAKPLWSQILVKSPSGDAYDGLGIALQGMGDSAGADTAFRKATEAGQPEGRLVNVYHEAARLAPGGWQSAEKCYQKLDGLSSAAAAGFEKTAVEHLKRTCTGWKSEH